MSSAQGEVTPVIAVVSKGTCRPRFFKAAAYCGSSLGSVRRQNLAAGADRAVYAVYSGLGGHCRRLVEVQLELLIDFAEDHNGRREVSPLQAAASARPSPSAAADDATRVRAMNSRREIR